MRRLLKAITPILLAFMLYIVYTGSIRLYDILTGLAVAMVVGIATSTILVKDWRKSLDVKRAVILLKYVLRYFLIDEVKAHLEVIRLGLSPRMPINPGIVRVPIQSQSEYAITLLALSITNTPGTVVIDVDKEKGVMYVNWIKVKGTEPHTCYKHIAYNFDVYAKRIFD